MVIEFKYSRKFSRLTTFDDEIDILMVKKLLQSIESDVAGNIFTYDKFDIEQYTKYFVSDFYFERPRTICYDNLEETIKRVHKTYFRFDYDKADRPSKEDDKSIIAQIIAAEGKQVRKNESVYGCCNEKIRYDLVTDDYFIKIFDFDEKDLKRLVNNAKTWAWNAMNSNEKRVMIIYRYNEEVSQYNNEFNIIMNIFKRSNIRVYDIEEGVRILQNLA